MVGIVAASGGENQIFARFLGRSVVDFRVGIGKGEDYGVRRHRAHHVGREYIGTRYAEKHIGTYQRLFERVYVAVGYELEFFGR